VTANIVLEDWSIFLPNFLAKDYTAAISGTSGQTDPDMFLYTTFHSTSSGNYMNFANAELDELLPAGRRSPTPRCGARSTSRPRRSSSSSRRRSSCSTRRSTRPTARTSRATRTSPTAATSQPEPQRPHIQYAIIHNVLSPLVYVNHLTETEFVLARSVDIAEDGLSYTFHLHEGVRFHDGSEVTAEDVKYTYEFYSQPGNTIAGRFGGMREVEVVDRYTARVHMNTVNASFLRIAARPASCRPPTTRPSARTPSRRRPSARARSA
jgi:ABC-type transport system substrate-binding protein